jgi:uncharacterized protein (TIGR01777 family)
VRILISGASGFIGTALVDKLRAEGHEVTRLVRHQTTAPDEVNWSPAAGILDFRVMDDADAVINLSGASISRLPWTKKYRREILESRVTATRTLADAMRQAANPPSVFLSGSAVGFYGDRPGELLTEYSSHGESFLTDVTLRWEETAALAPSDTRVVTFRTGVVVGDAGAMKPVRLLTKLGVSGRLGTGGQHWPWISIEDEVRAIVHLLDSTLSGPVNLVGPNPATADAIMSELARRMHRPYLIPVPERLLEVVLGDAADELLLASQKVRPARLLGDGFRFTHSTSDQAIDAMLAR